MGTPNMLNGGELGHHEFPVFLHVPHTDFQQVIVFAPQVITANDFLQIPNLLLKGNLLCFDVLVELYLA